MAEKFLITGGQGFIGAWIARLLVDRGVETVVFDRSPSNDILAQVMEPERLARLERVFGDISDSDRVREVFERERPTHVIHLAAVQVPVCRSDPLLGARINVIGTMNVFEAIRASAGDVKNVVYASSAAIAGGAEDYEGRVRDDDPARPRTHYGVFKTANEQGARVYFLEHGIPSVGLRPYTVYGVGREVGLTSGPTKAIKAAVLRRRYTIPFTGVSSFVYIEDLAEIFLRCALTELDDARALNIRGQVDTVLQFIAALREVFPQVGATIDCDGDEVPIAADLDESGLEELLGEGGVPCTPLREGIERTARHFERLARKGRLHDRDLEG